MKKAKTTDPLEDGTVRSIRLAKVRLNSCFLRYDLERLGMLTENDRLWALLVEKEKEILEAEMADLKQLGQGSAK